MLDTAKLLLSAIVLIPLASAQQVSCSISTDPRIFRAEGLSEPMGDIFLQCVLSRPGPSASPYLTSEVTVYLNTVATNQFRQSGGRNLTDAVLVINENNATPTASSTLGGPAPDIPVPQFAEPVPVASGGVASNGLVWRGVQLPLPGALSPSGRRFPDPTVLRITNVRANASFLSTTSITACQPASIFVYNSTVNDARALPGAEGTLSIGYVQQSLTVSIRPGPGAQVPWCRNYNVSAGAVSGPPAFYAVFQEGFPNAFRPLGTPSTDSNVGGEAGYPTPGIGATGGTATQGTRLLVQIFNVPAGVRVAAPKEVVNGSLRLRMTRADASGAGPYTPVAGDGLEEALAAGAGQFTFVYEVITSDPSAAERAEIPVVAGFTANQGGGQPALGTAVVTASLAPLSTGASSSATAPIPRFVDFGTLRNAFSVVPCCASCTSLTQIDPATPLITGLNPQQLTSHDIGSRLTISGTGFVNGSIVEWNDGALPTTFVSPTELNVGVDGPLLRANSREYARIAVRNPGELRSNGSDVTIVHPFRIDGLADAASGTSSLAGGGLASLYGVNLPRRVSVQWGASPGQQSADSPILSAAPTQINFQIPYEATGSAAISAINSDGWQRSATATILNAAPSVFCSGATPVITHANGELVSSARPAASGEVIIVYLTGLGRTSGQPATGAPAPLSPLARAVLTVSARLAGSIPDGNTFRTVTAEGEVLFAGLTPGFVGLGQVNVRLPKFPPEAISWNLSLAVGDYTSLLIPLAFTAGAP